MLYSFSVGNIWQKIYNIYGTKKIDLQIPLIKPKVAIIEITDSSDFKKTNLSLIDAAKNNTISGIILIIDSGGGSIGPYSVLHDLIKKITTTKPIIALILGDALSGGYLIASATNYIIAHNGSGIGSIGIFCEIRRYKETTQKTNEIEAQMTIEVFKAGKFKTIYHPYEKDLSDAEKNYIKEGLDKAYQTMKKIIASNRNLDLEHSTEWAEGKIFFAAEALELGLIDEIGTCFDAENKIIELISQRKPLNRFATEIEPIYYE